LNIDVKSKQRGVGREGGTACIQHGDTKKRIGAQAQSPPTRSRSFGQQLRSQRSAGSTLSISTGRSHLGNQHQLVELSSISSETCSNGIAPIRRNKYDKNNFRTSKRLPVQSSTFFANEIKGDRSQGEQTHIERPGSSPRLTCSPLSWAHCATTSATGGSRQTRRWGRTPALGNPSTPPPPFAPWAHPVPSAAFFTC